MTETRQNADASAVTALASQLANISLQHNHGHHLGDSQPASLFNPDDQFDLGDLSGFVEGNAGHSAVSLKNKLLHPTEADLKSLKDQLDHRIRDGHGETMFEIGIEDDGTPMNLELEEFQVALLTLEKVLKELGADYAIMDERDTTGSTSSTFAIPGMDETAEEVPKPVEDTITLGIVTPSSGKVAHLMIRKKPLSVDELLEIRVAVVGNVSTLLGVLTKGVLDDGRGKARVNLFRHKHEVQSGRTSSVCMEILGFDSKSQIITHVDGQHGRNLTWDDICTHASKVLSFIDLAGHEKYLKTTVFGMTGCAPDFVMLMVGANAGVIGMTKEHLGLALSLAIPVLVVITKIDMCPTNILENTVKQLTKILRSPGCRKIPMFIKTTEDVVVTAVSIVLY
ncbi:hypothetical protein BC938DRAFT_481601 [Jimgerdemannia flammicorona]|uniref:Tr-type G domain-containing protein n=1 Tax=Jimgerdemannia flammicorona TaxID=994334 RepID=A0A433QWZ2_9FUNG|nr:hypothetical protein BC938DRAFT_481601 [Jimgerdemannia flammicorona]